MKPPYLKSKHDAGLTYEAHLATNDEKADKWNTIYEQVTLTPP